MKFCSVQDALDYVKSQGKFSNSLIWRNFTSGDELHSEKCKALGINQAAEDFCIEIEPDGEWFLSTERTDNQIPRYQLYYSRFLPYAITMTLSEHDGSVNDLLGISFDSIVELFNSVMGFVNFGTGIYPFIDPRDTKLFQNIYDRSIVVNPPKTVYDEVWFPCGTFVYFKKPEIIEEHFVDTSVLTRHARQIHEWTNNETGNTQQM